LIADELDFNAEVADLYAEGRPIHDVMGELSLEAWEANGSKIHVDAARTLAGNV
jgi:hypothetical protein